MNLLSIFKKKPVPVLCKEMVSFGHPHVDMMASTYVDMTCNEPAPDRRCCVCNAPLCNAHAHTIHTAQYACREHQRLALLRAKNAPAQTAIPDAGRLGIIWEAIDEVMERDQNITLKNVCAVVGDVTLDELKEALRLY